MSCNTENDSISSNETAINIIPFPNSLIQKKGVFEITEMTKILADKDTKSIAQLFIGSLTISAKS